MDKRTKPKGRLCTLCNVNRAALKRPKTLEQICRECFYTVFEDEIHRVILDNHLFKPGERIAIGASGGKDSTVLAYVMSELNRRHNYGLDLFLLSVDEGITGYRDDSLETYGLPLKVVSYSELYGWTMDEIVKLIGLKNNCTFCGVFRRQALDRGAALLKVDKLVTGHNADDIAETVLLNILRGIYSPNAYRGFAREFIKDLERLSNSVVVMSDQEPFLTSSNQVKTFGSPPLQKCQNKELVKDVVIYRARGSVSFPFTGWYTSLKKWCKACVLLEGLNRGLPKLGIGQSRGINSERNTNMKQANGTQNLQSKQCGSLDF
ncbi:Cytoplasmic tRNA 2-thiolation protein 1 [Capsicum annuum]|nr:Cytoplasmic tRNA 2-thiolation protein 1 [Capsicum annuum]KAF3642133.1 Cytoplasmic tRNA 2-thiolation protein 1 [Capsicum annuum]